MVPFTFWFSILIPSSGLIDDDLMKGRFVKLLVLLAAQRGLVLRSESVFQLVELTVPLPPSLSLLPDVTGGHVGLFLFITICPPVSE